MVFWRRHHSYTTDYGGKHPYDEFMRGLKYLSRSNPTNIALPVLLALAKPEPQEGQTEADALHDTARFIKNILTHAASHHHKPYDSFPFSAHQEEIIHTALHIIATAHVGLAEEERRAKRMEQSERLMIELLSHSGDPKMVIAGSALAGLFDTMQKHRKKHLDYLREHESEHILEEETVLWKEFHDQFMEELRPAVDLFQMDFRHFDFVNSRSWHDRLRSNEQNERSGPMP